MNDDLQLPGNDTEIGAALQVALEACDEADRLSLASFRQQIEVETKADSSFVTAADRAVEEAVRRRLSTSFPSHGLVGEEYGVQAAQGGRRWIIDPIDGTHNYMRGVPIYATLLALEIDGRLDVGVVSAPALGRRWFSWLGGGAWAVDLLPGGWDHASAVRLSVSSIKRLEESSLVYSSFPSITESGLAPGFTNLLGRVWRDRGLGDFYGYMLVAEGAAEAMVEAELKLWDLAAPRAVLEHAGGRVSDLAGAGEMPDRGVVASNGHVHEALLQALASTEEGP